MHSGSEMLQNTLKNHSVSNGGYWLCSCKTFIGIVVLRNSRLVYRNAPVSHLLACIRVAKCSKRHPKILLGLMEPIGCVRAKTFVGTVVPRNSALVYRNAPVSHLLSGNRVAKCSKTHPKIILGLMEAIRCVHAKTFV